VFPQEVSEFTTFASVPWIRILDPEWNNEEVWANVEELLRVTNFLNCARKNTKDSGRTDRHPNKGMANALRY
jgi:hypothetical protein